MGHREPFRCRGGLFSAALGGRVPLRRSPLNYRPGAARPGSHSGKNESQLARHWIHLNWRVWPETVDGKHSGDVVPVVGDLNELHAPAAPSTGLHVRRKHPPK